MSHYPDSRSLNVDSKQVKIWDRYSPVGGAPEIDQDEFNAAVEMVRHYKVIAVSYDGKAFFQFTENDIRGGLDGYTQKWRLAWMGSASEDEVIQGFLHNDHWYTSFDQMAVLYLRALQKMAAEHIIPANEFAEVGQNDQVLDYAADLVAQKLIEAAEAFSAKERARGIGRTDLTDIALFRNFLKQTQPGMPPIQRTLEIVKSKGFDVTNAQFINGFFDMVREKIEVKLSS